MLQSMAIRYSDDYIVFWKVEKVDAVPNQYQLQIVSRMLDNVGFTNYKFNLNGTEEHSIISPIYWWTDDTKTVWEHLQDICRDSQMTAVVDENNVLQFYTRDYLFDNSRSIAWTFRYNPDGNKLANIISFTKQDLVPL